MGEVMRGAITLSCTLVNSINSYLERQHINRDIITQAIGHTEHEFPNFRGGLHQLLLNLSADTAYIIFIPPDQTLDINEPTVLVYVNDRRPYQEIVSRIIENYRRHGYNLRALETLEAAITTISLTLAREGVEGAPQVGRHVRQLVVQSYA